MFLSFPLDTPKLLLFLNCLSGIFILLDIQMRKQVHCDSSLSFISNIQLMNLADITSETYFCESFLPYHHGTALSLPSVPPLFCPFCIAKHITLVLLLFYLTTFKEVSFN